MFIVFNIRSTGTVEAEQEYQLETVHRFFSMQFQMTMVRMISGSDDITRALLMIRAPLKCK
jgi:hypothetical protein